MKQAIIIVVIVLAVTGLAYWMLETMDGGKKGSEKANNSAKFEDFQRSSAAGNLKIEDIVEGTGKTAKSGDTVVVHYTGKLANGKQFDSSVGRGEPFEFTLGQGKVIQGWDQGIPGMKVGGKRKLIIPSELGYGARGAGADIPPYAELHFEVELLKIK
jgi:FKBP-type peptidyl-prolyl cis-trans isomerase